MIYNFLYKTQPLIIHKPGEKSIPLWEETTKWFFKQTSIEATLPSELTIITWNTSATSLLERCLNKLKIKFLVLGKGQKNWKNPMKIELLNEILPTIKTKWIMGLDSFDVLMIGCPTKILETFKRKNCSLIYNCGPINWPPIENGLGNFEKNIAQNYPFPYLNAGVFIGKTDFCKSFYENAYRTTLTKSPFWDTSEQLYIKNAFPDFYPKIQLDYTCSMFQIVHPAAPADWIQLIR